MLFQFEKRDDGLFATHAASCKAVAHVETRVLGENNDPRLRVPEKTVTPLPRDRWRIHFTACKLSPDELAAFVEELAAQGAD